jgi:hypothetical protein
MKLRNWYTYVYELTTGKKVYINADSKKLADLMIQPHIPFGESKKFLRRLK